MIKNGQTTLQGTGRPDSLFIKVTVTGPVLSSLSPPANTENTHVTNKANTNPFFSNFTSYPLIIITKYKNPDLINLCCFILFVK